MKQGKRKLHLDRTTVRPLNPQQLARIAGGTGVGGTDDNQSLGSDIYCTGSNTQNYSNDLKCEH
jgi:hypothetical protein